MEIVHFPGTYAGVSVRDPVKAFPALVACAELSYRPGYHIGEHDHRGTFEFMYLMRGSCGFWIEGRRTTANAGEVFFIHPDEQHALDIDVNAKTQVLWTRLDLSKLSRLGEMLEAKLRHRPGRVLHGAFDVEPILRAVIRQAIGRGPRFAQIVRTHIRLFVEILLQRIEMNDEPSQPRTSRARPATDPVVHVRDGPWPANTLSAEIIRAIASIGQQLDTRLQIGTVAAAAGYSVAYLYERFNDEVGISPREYHLNLRLGAVKEALLRPESTVLTVAELFGFSSGQHLSTTFAKAFGMSPTTWREQYRMNGDRSPIPSPAAP